MYKSPRISDHHCQKIKGKVEKNIQKIEKPKDVGHFLIQKPQKSQNVDFCACLSQEGKLPCCKCIFDQIKANLAEIQPENHPKCPKNAFFAKIPTTVEVNGLIEIAFSLKK